MSWMSELSIIAGEHDMPGASVDELYAVYVAAAEPDEAIGARAEEYDDALERLAGELSDFTVQCPIENIRDGECDACSYPVRAHHGVFAIADRGERGMFGVHLHGKCASDVQWARRHFTDGND
jgi:hypothetical protein